MLIIRAHMRKTAVVVVSLLLAFLAMHAVAHPLANDCPCVTVHAELELSPLVRPFEQSIERSDAPVTRLSRSPRPLAVFAPRPPPSIA